MEETRYSKRLRTGTRRRYQDDGISDDEIEGKTTFDLEEKLESSYFNSDLVKIMDGKDFTFEYIQREGLRDPIIFTKADGLGIQMPDQDFSVSDVKLFVGSRRMIDVMDVRTQKGMEMSMSQWRRYYETPASEREKLYNVISLEFSHTKLEHLVKRPASVDLIDWVDNMWPRHLKESQRDSTNVITDMQYPKVQKYCLMSVKGCFTDFHIDFGGTSVWYHILRGRKVFWLIPPTPHNLERYEDWVLSGKQGDIFLGDKTTACQRIELKQGYTFMIPSGWIHAVYTPEDTLVFGGNFLHSFNIPMQLNIYNIEDRTRVPAKFRYPFYYEMCWYVLERYLYCLTNTSHLTPEFQRHSLGIGLTKDDFAKPNNEDDEGKEEVKEEGDKEEEEAAPSPLSRPGVKVHLTPLELEGLWQLLYKLESLPTHKKCVPAGIRNAPALLSDIRALLEEHANDDPKLSYTGKPIVTWPKRPSWYRPCPPSPSIMYRPRASVSGPAMAPVPRPSKPASSISALRRRRVRCKRCEACVRSVCGDCVYCRDMKKFGGPGRLKKSCILRQCLAPALPLTAVCAICKEGSQEDAEGTQTTQTLMECSECGQITHPECITVPGEGVVNKDLPSCWECPKCVHDKNTESSSSTSEEEDKSTVTPSTHSSAPPAKRADREGIGVGGLRLGRKGQPPPSPSSLPLTRSRRQPPPSQRILLQHQQSRKRAGALEQQHRKRIKLERSKLFQSTRPSVSVSPKLLRQRSLERGSMIRAALGRSMSRRRGMSSYQGREVRLRSEARGRALRGRTEREEDGEDNNKEEENEKTERRENGLGGKENRPQGYGGRPTEDENGDAQQNGEGETEREEDREQARSDSSGVLGDETRDQRSCVTVTLQPSRGRRDPSTIVPKLEANVTSVSHTQSSSDFQGKSLLRPPLRGDARHADKAHSHTHSHGARLHLQSHTLTRSTSSKHAHVSQSLRCSTRESHHNTTQERNGKNVRPERGKPPASSPSSASCTSPEQNGASEPGWGRLVWVSVFRYLTRTELCICMAVCKSWYKWGCDKRLWTHISLSRCQSISPQALSGIIKRQPVTLDLSWAKISKKQLTWLINRLPGLKDLVLSGCNWTSVSALSSPSCPLLRSLDLRWVDGVKDAQIRELLSPPGSNNRSQLRNMQCLRLCGLDVTEATLRLIIRHMPQLTRLELSHCPLTDNALNLLTAVGSSTRNTLAHLNLAGCSRLTDSCLAFLQRLSCLSVLDLRDCKGISREACEKFISQLSVNALYCLSDDKLIQRIS